MSYNIEEITKEKFSKFGDFIKPEEVKSTNINLNTTKSYFDLANIEIDGEDKRVRINLFEAKKRNFPLKIDMLENHPFSSQVFFPLGNNPFIVVVCPANEKPNLNHLSIFKVDNGFGVNFKPRVWHFPLISTEDTNFLVIDRKGKGENLIIHKFEKEKIILSY